MLLNVQDERLVGRISQHTYPLLSLTSTERSCDRNIPVQFGTRSTVVGYLKRETGKHGTKLQDWKCGEKHVRKPNCVLYIY